VKTILPLLGLCIFAHAEQIPIGDASRFEFKNARGEVTEYRGARALRLIEQEGASGQPLAMVKGVRFHNGSIDVDVSGAPSKTAGEQARGFIGVAFRMQNGGSRFEDIYIRPTNGRADDQLRRNHAVQYESVPDWPWDRLRKESPGVYEAYADMVAGEWTHLRVVVHGTNASLYVGGSSQPCLVVRDLKLGDSEGEVALWAGPGTDGYFRNLEISPESGKRPQYGANDAAGHYAPTPDARIYYEVYGEGGTPLVLLHGGEYGYIDEFSDLIREMSKQHMVVAIATRGYGRSERGSVPLSHQQFAQDAAVVIQNVFPGGEKVDLLGFSEGAITAYIVASAHPERIRRLIAIGGGLGLYGETKEAVNAEPLTPELMQKQVPDLVASRKKVMAHPEQFGPLIRELDLIYHQPVWVKEEVVHAIAAPTLIMAGDRDDYNRIDHLVDVFHMLPKGQMALIPGCGHVVLNCKADLVIRLAGDFLDSPGSK